MDAGGAIIGVMISGVILRCRSNGSSVLIGGGMKELELTIGE